MTVRLKAPANCVPAAADIRGASVIRIYWVKERRRLCKSGVKSPGPNPDCFGNCRLGAGEASGILV